ncbi:GHKL domain-containing protein [TM7 phylum sp. oral taxon 349]|nr:GHKL domain-containing protein [TM7 phylum sp. oral taxon 349]
MLINIITNAIAARKHLKRRNRIVHIHISNDVAKCIFRISNLFLGRHDILVKLIALSLALRNLPLQFSSLCR